MTADSFVAWFQNSRVYIGSVFRGAVCRGRPQR